MPPPAGRRQRPQDGISRKQKLAAAEKYFRGSLWWLWDLWEFIGERDRAEGARGAHKPARRAPPRARLGGLWPPGVPPCVVLKSSDAFLLWKKSSRRFYSVWTPFNILICKRSKTRKKQKLALGTELIG
jgi:hypothetical protein